MEETASSPPQQKKTLEFIPSAWHFVAIERRYMGETYEQIQMFLEEKFKRKFRSSSLRRWFMRGGVLHDRYFEYAAAENERRRREVQEQLKSMTSLIPKKLTEILENRYVRTKDGDYFRLEDGGEKIPVLDMVTVAALKQLSELLGFKVDGGPTGDPVDRFFERIEDETPEPHDATPAQADPKPVDPPVA